MIKIMLIAPYKELVDLAIATFKEHNAFESSLGTENHHIEYKLDAVFMEKEDVRSLKLDADVIISRGGTANIFKRYTHNIPLVEIPLAGNDLIHCLHECKQLYGQKQVGVIGFSNVNFGVEGLSDIIGLKIKAYIMKSMEQIPEVVDLAASEGCQVIIGGLRTKNYAISKGLQAVIPRTGKETLWQAITEAKRVAHISRVEQEKTQLFKTILDYSYEGVIAVDRNSMVSVFNSTAQKALSIKTPQLSGRKIDEILPVSKITEFLSDNKEHMDELISHKSIQLAVNKVPIVLKGENVGKVVTFHDVTKIQELEGKIREKIHSRGHIAKHSFKDIIGESQNIKSAMETAKNIAHADSNILIIGQTGTGKELFAQSIHNYSKRSKGPFVAVNCAALPEGLLESELFGYVEGAFTGAAKGGKLGLFELAHQGTIFLDEIAELSLKLQSRILRVLQEKEIMRLGHDRVIPVDIRVISATNENLYEMVKKKCFREDLYYRLDVLRMNLPSLEERREDIPLIVDYLMTCFGKEKKIITEQAKKVLQELEWPGNIRELKNICERLVVLCKSEVIDENEMKSILLSKLQDNKALNMEDKHILELSNDEKDTNKPYKKEFRNIDKEQIKELLEQEGYIKTRVAKRLGIDRATLWRKMKEMNMI